MTTDRTLSLVDLGVDSDVQPDDQFPELKPGNYLRWAFAPHRGFPRNGYYVYRREHGPRSEPIRLSVALDRKYHKLRTRTEFSTPGDDGEEAKTFTFSDSSSFTFSQNFEVHADGSFTWGNDTIREVVLDADAPQEITLPETAARVDLSLAVEGDGSMTVTAFAGDQQATQANATGMETVTLTAEGITRVRLEGDRATLVELLCYPLLAEVSTGWQLLADAPKPIALPMSHPDYPANQGGENLAAARATAHDRISYGDPDRFVPNPMTIEDGGTATVENGSSIVTGDATGWKPGHAGSVFSVDGDDTAYVVTEVLDSERLVLSRAYNGASTANATYELADDPFGQLHDYLTHLVDGGPAAGGMGNRTVPEPVYDEGSLARTKNDTKVDGSGTNWNDDFEGLSLRVARDVSGTVTVMAGVPMAISQTADWDDDLVGDHFRIQDERNRYTIKDVQQTTYGTVHLSILRLDRPVSGPHHPSQGVDYDIFEADGVEVASVDDSDTLHLATRHAGPDDATDRDYILGPSMAAPSPTAPDAQTPRTPFQYPLDLLTMASLDPAVAQLLGCYWIDESASADKSYDYLVIADHGAQSPKLPLRPVPSQGIQPGNLPAYLSDAHVDWAVTFDVQRGDATALDAPEDLKAYALPPSGTRSDVGLRWNQSDDPATDDAVGLYYLWRNDCGSDPPSAPPTSSSYEVLTHDDSGKSFMETAEPIPRTSDGENPPQRPTGWPPDRMHTVDTNLGDGWFSYRLSAMDLFGRHSTKSAPATWTDWDPKGPHGHSAAGHAIEVESDLPPPPPSGVEASTLDPADQHVRTDEAYETWRANNQGEVGLRVRWRWPKEHAAGAPDVDEFDVHFRPGRLNALVGEITDVSSSGDGYHIETNIGTNAPDDQFAGAMLQVGARGFPIVESGGDPLWVEVDPADPTADTAVTDGGVSDLDDDDLLGGGTIGGGEELEVTFAPVSTGDDCSVAIPPVYNRGTVTIDNETTAAGGKERAVVHGSGTGWPTTLEDETFRTADDVAEYTIYRVDSPTKLLLDRAYDPPTESPGENLSYAIAHPAGTDYTDVGKWPQTLTTVPYVDVHKTDDDGTRVYETFVTLADTTDFEPSLSEPSVYGNVSVTAVDAADQGGPVAAPAKVVRVWREKPEPPAIPVIDADFEFGSEADYHSKSSYTVRWEKSTAGLQTHVFRALDETLFSTDWARRQAAIDAGQADAVALSESDHDRFPKPLQPDDADDEATQQSKTKSREMIATELNRLNDSNDIASKEEAMSFYRSLRDPENETDDVEMLKPAMMRVLAGLPGNEPAYTQVTVDPLDPDDCPNKPGPDTGPGESYPQGNLCAYVDSFDGRSKNCYFYRTGTVDPAGNRSDQRTGDEGEAMSYPTPGVKAPDVVPPKKPVVTKILAGDPDEPEAGDRMITAWLAPATGVADYRVYRADEKDATRDLRLMDEVAAGVSAADSGETVWTDEDVEPFTTQYYRFVAVDEAGNRSDPSAVVSARAFDDSRPDPPTWTEPTTDQETGTLELGWESDDANLRSLVQRRVVGDTAWNNRSPWVPRGEYSYEDDAREDGTTYEYRLLVLDTDGRSNDSYEVLTH